MTRFRVGSASHVGQIRSNNQDSKLVADGVSVFAVADGMGGHQGGEVASAIAVETLEATITEPTTDSVVEAVKEANRRIFSRASDAADLRGMGTTLVAIALVNQGADDEEVAWVNVGDSRVYLLRDEELHQLSRDHSLVEDLRRGGQLSDEEAAVHPQRNILTRALGIDSEVEVDHGAVVPLQSDRFLLCSDGLFNEVDRATLITTLSSVDDPDAAADELVRLANAGGGRDNITCVVVDVVDDGGRSERAAAAAATAAAVPVNGADADGNDAASLAPTVEMPAVDVEADEPEATPVPAAGADAAAAEGAATTTDAPTPAPAAGDAPLPPEAAPPTQPGLGPPPPPPPPPPAEPDGPAPPPPPGATSGAAPVAGFPTEDDNDSATSDSALPFGRETNDVFGDIDKAKGRHWAVTVLAVAVILGVVGGALYAGGSWYANRTYFLDARDDRVVIFQGRPGGFLVFDPSVAEDFDDEVAVADLSPDAQEAVDTQREFSSLANARSFVNVNTEDEPEPTTTTTTTTEPESTTTTTTEGPTTTRPTTTTTEP